LEEETVDVVERDDTPCGQALLSECLRTGELHRAVATLVWRSDGKVILQRRSLSDQWQPGLWTLSSTGHVRLGETYEEAALRELGEELGLRMPLTLNLKSLLPPIRSGALVERERVALFVGESDNAPSADPSELAETKDVSLNDLREMMTGADLTEDAVVLLSKYFSTLPD
jgi:isopentenyl-diphosphate Delta-isomerase